MKTIQVNTPDHQYQVIIAPGLLKQLGSAVKKVWLPQKVAVISDAQVAKYYQADVVKALKAAGFNVFAYQFPIGEKSKNLTTLATLVGKLAQAHFNRDDGIIALGGGVTGDLAGLLAATYMRGIHLIQVPTSLLSQVDSSVGGKTAVDLDDIKNIIGSFYQPDLVLIDPKTLHTLNRRNLIEEYGEIVKTAALKGGKFWQLIEQINQPDDILKHASELSYRSIQFKRDIVVADEKETGQRQLLNFGHTIGHAIEALSHGRLMHGEDVGIGMLAMSKIFENRGLTKKGTTQAIYERLIKVGLPTTSSLTQDPQVLVKIKNDKKNRHGHLNLVYLKTIGQPMIKSIATKQVPEFLK